MAKTTPDPTPEADQPTEREERIRLLREQEDEEERLLRRRVLRMQEQREIMLLEETEEQQQQRIEARKMRSQRNALRQTELAEVRAAEERLRNFCRHKQGGFRKKLYQGDGKPCVTCYVMPDGVTLFLQCTRCRANVYTPHPNLEQRNPALYHKQKAFFDKMLELHEESGLDLIKGPTFTFTKFGVPFIPERRGLSPELTAA